ncbi:MAG: methylcrotonoyl-CoA carboxylase [Sediminimonas qiaohouensis]|uniref:Methylcrotonoyl-CoA carboxylase n=1 Tax=Sediminimonas qiaohouensis TaxID=552061 RepID=A0A7C9HN38_9RHOB|nr:carboxyl transferase domain-containing protein [Sediminimonas qiaohouensis]MTJ05588.1 methylcrotonoyl-CoA carboxylase [Sediminimonas qiaohouensis]
MTGFQTRVQTQSAEFEENRAANYALISQLKTRMAEVVAGGAERLRQRHAERGKLLVRDRIDRVIDPGTAFLELSPLAAWEQYGGDVNAAGIVTGVGIVHGRPVVIIANDATVKGGSFFHETVKKHLRAQEIAEANRLPCLYLVDCGGAYLPEQDRVFPDRDHFGNAFHRQCQMSAQGLPQISVVFGGCTAGGAYIPALSDQVIMVRGNARIHLGGPSIVKVAINEDIDGEALGGAEMHTNVSGVSDHLAETEEQGLALARRLLRDVNVERVPVSADAATAPSNPASEIAGIISADAKTPYDVRELLLRLVDGGDFQEFKPNWGKTLVCATARIHGMRVGILGNNGALLSESALKAAHFISMCDQRGIPLLFLQNITGFMVGSEAERGGIAKNSAKMVYAMSTARVPRLTVVVGGSYGAGNYGMCGRGFRPDFLFAWPTAKVATMSADIASNVLLELRRSNYSLPEASDEELGEIDARTRAQYAEQSDPYYATSRLWDDGLIAPEQTREVVALCLWLVLSRPEARGHTPVFRM